MSFLSQMASNVMRQAAPMVGTMRQMGQMAEELDGLGKLMQTYSAGGNVQEALARMGKTDNRVASFQQTIQGKSDAELRAAADELARRKGVDLNQFIAQLSGNVNK